MSLWFPMCACSWCWVCVPSARLVTEGSLHGSLFPAVKHPPLLPLKMLLNPGCGETVIFAAGGTGFLGAAAGLPLCLIPLWLPVKPWPFGDQLTPTIASSLQGELQSGSAWRLVFMPV